MSSQQAEQEDHLLELLIQLKVCKTFTGRRLLPSLEHTAFQRTTPDQARAILQVQPKIAYALMAVMVNLNAINVEVVQVCITSMQSTAVLVHLFILENLDRFWCCGFGVIICAGTRTSNSSAHDRSNLW